jgi:hypothetical protein
MKNIIQTLGAISVLVLFVGIVFKIFHWPGASVIVSISVLALLVFFVIYLLKGVNVLSTSLEKTIAVIGTLTLCVLLAGFLFKINHWPGAGALAGIPQLGFLITGALMLFDAVRETDKAKQSIKTLFSFTLLILAAVLFLLLNIKELFAPRIDTM